MPEIIKSIDITILTFIQNYLQNPLFDKVMIFFTNLGDAGFIWILLSILLIISKKYRKVGLLCLISLFLTTITIEGFLKNIVQRDRPFLDYPSINLLIKKPMSYSFPSGHSASSFAVATIIGLMIKKYKIVIFSLAFMIAFSRLYLFVHYPFDVICGSLIGFTISYLLVYKYERYK